MERTKSGIVILSDKEYDDLTQKVEFLEHENTNFRNALRQMDAYFKSEEGGS